MILAIFVVVFVLLRRYDKLQQDFVGRRQKHAGKMAYKKLKTAETLMKQNKISAFMTKLVGLCWIMQQTACTWNEQI